VSGTSDDQPPPGPGSGDGSAEAAPGTGDPTPAARPGAARRAATDYDSMVAGDIVAAPRPAPPPPPAPEPPPTPATAEAADDELRDAIAAPRAGDRADDLDAPDAGLGRGPRGAWKRRAWSLVASLAFVGIVVGAVIIAGRINAGRYTLRCTTDKIIAERGRRLPPWGTLPLTGPGWKPIGIPPEAECTERHTRSRGELEDWYLVAAGERVTAYLTPRDTTGVPTADVDAADALLAQALLLTRAPERRDQRADLERLLGDVAYWRAVARVRSAADTLDAAAKGFSDAAAQRPRHATDAAAWAERARSHARALRAGADEPLRAQAEAPLPPGAPGSTVPGTTPAAPVTGPPLPPGLAQPPTSPPTAAPVDAGVPGGGVLL
jgi:hypothetical protein